MHYVAQWHLERVQLSPIESHLCWNLHLLLWNAVDFDQPFSFYRISPLSFLSADDFQQDVYPEE